MVMASNFHESREFDRDDDAPLDPQRAAALLQSTTNQAQRQFTLVTPLLSLARGATFLIGFGAVWMSVRGQHPFKGPSGGSIAVLYFCVFLVVVLTIREFSRATSGVSGASRQQMRGLGLGIVPAWILLYVFMGALAHSGVSHAIAYGIFPATGPIVFVGAAAAAAYAAQNQWSQFWVATGVATVAAIGAFSGPVNAWAVTGCGAAAAFFGAAVVQVWHYHQATNVLA
jgi:hypothetical protein